MTNLEKTVNSKMKDFVHVYFLLLVWNILTHSHWLISAEAANISMEGQYAMILCSNATWYGVHPNSLIIISHNDPFWKSIKHSYMNTCIAYYPYEKGSKHQKSVNYERFHQKNFWIGMKDGWCDDEDYDEKMKTRVRAEPVGTSTAGEKGYKTTNL